MLVLVVGSESDAVVVAGLVVVRRVDQSGAELTFVEQIGRLLVVSIHAHRDGGGDALGYANIEVMAALGLYRRILRTRGLVRRVVELRHRSRRDQFERGRR